MSAWRSLVASSLLRATQWQFETDLPPLDKYVLLAVPHTSNWDGLLLVLLAKRIGLELSWTVKESWLRGPQAHLMRRLGAVAIDRSRANNVVAAMAAEFAARDRFVLAVPPEGSRSYRDHWKSGFYHIARSANVPVVPGYLDFARKRAGLGPAIELTGDVRSDMDQIRAFYARQSPAPRHPDSSGPIRLRIE